MKKGKRKYCIKELYDTLPAGLKIKAMKEDAEKMGITVNHLRKIWAYKVGEVSEAKFSQLLIIADRFHVSVESLFNEPANVSP